MNTHLEVFVNYLAFNLILNVNFYECMTLKSLIHISMQIFVNLMLVPSLSLVRGSLRLTLIIENQQLPHTKHLLVGFSFTTWTILIQPSGKVVTTHMEYHNLVKTLLQSNKVVAILLCIYLPRNSTWTLIKLSIMMDKRPSTL